MPAWSPVPSDVAAVIAQRTIDATGLPTGTFSSTTVPTDTQVTALIADVSGEIAAAAGDIPTVLDDDAKLVAILGAAWLVEVSFDGGSDLLANMLGVRYQAALARLVTAVAQVNQSGQVEPEGMPPQALSEFPDLLDPWVDATTKFSRW